MTDREKKKESVSIIESEEGPERDDEDRLSNEEGMRKSVGTVSSEPKQSLG